MWFIYFWIISTLICIVVNKIAGTVYEKDLKAEGYDLSKIKITLTTKMNAYTILVIPFFNILVMFTLLLSPQQIKANIIDKYKLIKNNPIE